MKRKLLSCLLALCMTAALVVPAIAEGTTEAKVAETGGTEYATLAEAVTAAAAGATVTLLDNTALTSKVEINKALTLDLGGKKLTGPNSASTIWVKAGASDEVRITNGTIENQGRGITCFTGRVTLGNGLTVSTTERALDCRETSQTTIESGCVLTNSGQDCTVFVFGGEKNSTAPVGPTLNIYGSVKNTYTTGWSAVSGNGNDQVTGTTINIGEGAVIESKAEAVYLPQKGATTISGGTITGAIAVGVKAGTLNITGGTLTGTGAYLDDTMVFSNGINPDGSAILVETNTDYAGKMNLLISDGKLISTNSHAIREVSKPGETAKGVISLGITGGEFTSASDKTVLAMRAVTADETSLSGGAYSANPTTAGSNVKLADGYVVKETAGKFVVQKPTVAPWEVAVPNGGSAETTANVGEFLLKGAAVVGGMAPGDFAGPWVRLEDPSLDLTNGFAMSVELKAPTVADGELFAWTFGVNGPDGNRVTETAYVFQKTGGAVTMQSVAGIVPAAPVTITEGQSFVLRTEFYANESGKLAARCYVDDAQVLDIPSLKTDGGAEITYTDVKGPRYGWLCSSTVAAGLLAKLPTAAALTAPVYTLTLSANPASMTTSDAAGITVTASADKDGAAFAGGVTTWELTGDAKDLLTFVSSGNECTVKPDPAKADALAALTAPKQFQVKAVLYADDTKSKELAAATTGTLTLKPDEPGTPGTETEYTLSFQTGTGGSVSYAVGTPANFLPAGNPLTITSSDAVYVKLTPNAGNKINTARLTYVGGSAADVLTPAQMAGTASLPTGKTGDRTLAVTFTSNSTGGSTYYPPSDSTTTPGEPAAPPTIDESQALSELNDDGKSEAKFEVSKPVVVNEKLFAAAVRSGKNMTFAVLDDSGELLYQWEFDGKRIVLPQVAMSLGIQISGLGDKGTEAIGALAKQDEGLVLSFQHAGQLPGPARVTLNVAGQFPNGAKLNYYYFNPSQKRLELVAKGLIVSNGSVALPQAHCSEYLLTTQEVAGAAVTTPAPAVSNPQTGDSNPAFGWMAALLLAAGGLLVLGKKKLGAD